MFQPSGTATMKEKNMSGMVAPLEVGICCDDADRLVSFYIDVLAAKLIATHEVGAGKAREAAIGFDGFRVARVQLPTGERLKFLQPERRPRLDERPGTILERRNTTYLTFIVDDIADTARRLLASGATFLSGEEPVDIRPGVSILLALDPEQNLIEFVRYADLSSYRPELAGSGHSPPEQGR